jgi:GNAT superfamily N-acetyltransferase
MATAVDMKEVKRRKSNPMDSSVCRGFTHLVRYDGLPERFPVCESKRVQQIQGPLPLEQALALSSEAGWNQTREDWERLSQLAGNGCFGIVDRGRLVSTAVALIYEPRLAWIGMVITALDYRGKGCARTLLERCLQYCDEQHVSCVKLDATDLGRPVYQKLGFVDERPVSRWVRKPGELTAMPSGITSGLHFHLDREAFGVDRSSLLRAFQTQETFAMEGQGHAFSRAGRSAWHFGPSVARDPQTAEALLSAFLARHGNEASQLDLCDENQDAVRIVQAAGFQPSRHLIRMYRGDPKGAELASGPLIYALGAFEYG